MSNSNGFDIGHELVMILCKAQDTVELDDAARVFNQGYAVLREQLSIREEILDGQSSLVTCYD